MWHQWDPGSEMNEAAGLRMAAEWRLAIITNFERAAVIVSSRWADLVGAPTISRQFALRRRPEGGGCRLTPPSPCAGRRKPIIAFH